MAPLSPLQSDDGSSEQPQDQLGAILEEQSSRVEPRDPALGPTTIADDVRNDATAAGVEQHQPEPLPQAVPRVHVHTSMVDQGQLPYTPSSPDTAGQPEGATVAAGQLEGAPVAAGQSEGALVKIDATTSETASGSSSDSSGPSDKGSGTVVAVGKGGNSVEVVKSSEPAVTEPAAPITDPAIAIALGEYSKADVQSR